MLPPAPQFLHGPQVLLVLLVPHCLLGPQVPQVLQVGPQVLLVPHVLLGPRVPQVPLP